MLGVSCIGAFYIFPYLYKAPFAAKDLKTYLANIGFMMPKKIMKHILLGIVLSLFTLGAMLIASILTGRYVFDSSTINLGQILRSLNAGIFEELFYRGIIMVILINIFKSVPKAFFVQIIIFGLVHIKGTDALSLFDAFFVVIMASVFSFSAIMTQSLWAGIVFHVLHDTLLFAVQNPKGEYIGVNENLIFYSFLFVGLIIGTLVILLSTKYLKVIDEFNPFSF
jgi:membrane protease YdiL (CAAX protease family)